MSYELILFDVTAGVATIAFNRPKVYNSFNQQMAMEVQKALDYCKGEDAVRAVYITGEGKAFCAGQDLAEVMDPEGPELSSIVRDHYNPIIMRLRQLEKPIVAAVNGVAAGAGANLALACDICVATESSAFIQAFSKIGLIPDSGGTYFLPRIIGLQKAAAYMMLGDKISATEAERVGMIYKVLSDETFAEESRALASKLAKMPTKGIGLTKRLLNESFNNDLPTQLHREDVEQTAAGKTYDYDEGVNAFLEKRKPLFTGE
jgi:2-(1,2-epoxy-1,2-dihydrophenyl)acetyl-CoA isomerase